MVWGPVGQKSAPALETQSTCRHQPSQIPQQVARPSDSPELLDGFGKVFSELLKYRQSKDEIAYGSPSDNEDFSF